MILQILEKQNNTSFLSCFPACRQSSTEQVYNNGMPPIFGKARGRENTWINQINRKLTVMSFLRSHKFKPKNFVPCPLSPGDILDTPTGIDKK